MAQHAATEWPKQQLVTTHNSATNHNTNHIHHNNHSHKDQHNANLDDKLPIFGWSKRLFYFLLFTASMLMVINFTLTLWIFSVLGVTWDGVTNLKITSRGISLPADVEFARKVRVARVDAEKAQGLRLDSARGIDIRAHAHHQANHVRVGEKGLEISTQEFVVKNTADKVKFSAKSDSVEIFTDNFRVKEEGGSTIHNSVQTHIISGHYGSDLRLDSPTRAIEITTPHGIYIDSQLGGISGTCLTDLKLQARHGSLKLEAAKIFFEGLPVVRPVPKNQSQRPNIFQTCLCENGRIFLAPPHENCRANNVVCL